MKRKRINIKRYFQTLGILLTVILLIFLGLLGAMNFSLGNDNANNLHRNDISTAKYTKDLGKLNVLVMGLDKDEIRTDAILLVSYDTHNNTVKALSIPRDTRMYIGNKYQKINSAYGLRSSNGTKLKAYGTVEAVTRLTGVPIHYYVTFTFDGIAECMDALGPVEFEIPDLGGDGVGMVYDDPAQDLHINLKPGVQDLDGEQIVHLLRYRKGNLIKGKRRTYTNGDIDRIALQQDFVKALVDQKLNASLITKIPQIFKSLNENINTNLTVGDVISFSTDLGLTNLTGDSISIKTLPGNFSGNEYEASYWICDIDATKELIQTEFGYDASNITLNKNTNSTEKPVSKNNSSSGSKKSDTDDTPKPTKKPASTQKTSVSQKDDDDEDTKTVSTKKPSSEKKDNSGNIDATKKPTSTPSATKKPESMPEPEEDTQNNLPQKQE